MLSAYYSLTDAGWSSSVARRAHNPKVVGSNPAPATKSEKAAFKAAFFIAKTSSDCLNRCSYLEALLLVIQILPAIPATQLLIPPI